MSFKSLNHILGAIENQAAWQASQEFQQLLKCWSSVVGVAVQAQTRPISISRGVLSVATSSAAWAQTLTFERQRILQKLNAHLGSNLVDIRFSTAQWQKKSGSSRSWYAQEQSVAWQEHPSRVVEATSSPSLSQKVELKEPHQAFQRWAEGVRERSQHSPLCPQCQCPTPPGELQRWAVCALCVVRQWKG
ncbi:DUF721 domain-containing protein [Coleofasciculus sp. H7-2]|uniref:DUF721 domain-containing protein n=1 Tax=Coleofasciculus sp. H7-2 TaxID=3351545 RepID=UPI0036721BCE